MIININDIEKNEGLNIDPVGFLFYYKNRLFRVINDAYKDEILFLFSSGLMKELNEADLIPFTKISDVELNGYDLIIEHHRIEPITFSSEWSFEMVKAAAKTIINVNKILFKYGFETKDAHNHNIVFDGYIPKFVDIGSFQRRKNNKYWECKDEFYRIFVHTLKIWSSGNSQLARKSISDVAGYLQRYEYTLYKYPILRLIPISLFTKISYFLEVLRNLSKFNLDTIFIVKKPELKRNILKFIKKVSLWGLLPHNNINLERLFKKIETMRRPHFKTKWGEYHSMVNKAEQFKEGGRFDIIIGLINKFNIKEVIEVGGNQGLLSIELKKLVDRIICSDYDEVAVDQMYLNIRKLKAEVTPVLLDILHPIYLCLNYSHNLKPQIRFKSQAVLALAISHHLILGQKVPIDFMFRILIEYTKEFLFIEFMPNGIDKSPNPDWYKIEWFRENFEKYFDIILERPSVEDGSRILFFGKLKSK